MPTRVASWRIDRNVPMALIATLTLGLLTQTVVVSRWSAGVDAQMAQFSREITRLATEAAASQTALSREIGEFRAGAEVSRDRTSSALQELSSRMTGVEVEVKSLVRMLPPYPGPPLPAELAPRTRKPG